MRELGIIKDSLCRDHVAGKATPPPFPTSVNPVRVSTPTATQPARCPLRCRKTFCWGWGAISSSLLGSRPPARRSGVILVVRHVFDSLTALRAVYQAGALFTLAPFADAPHKLVATGIDSVASACARLHDTHFSPSYCNDLLLHTNLILRTTMCNIHASSPGGTYAWSPAFYLQPLTCRS